MLAQYNYYTYIKQCFKQYVIWVGNATGNGWALSFGTKYNVMMDGINSVIAAGAD